MKNIKPLIITILVVTFIISIFSALVLNFLIRTIESVVITKIEKVINKEIVIKKMSFMPGKGIMLNNLAVHEKDAPEKVFLTADSLSFRANVPLLIKDKKLFLSVRFNNLKKASAKASGEVIIESGAASSFKDMVDKFYVSKITLSGIDIANNSFELKNISGDITIADNIITAPAIKCSYQGADYVLSFSGRDMIAAPSMDLKLSGERLLASATVSKNDSIVRISKADIRLGTSHIVMEGDIFDMLTMDVALSLITDINLEDLYLTPDTIKNKLAGVRLDGIVHAKTFIKGPLTETAKLKADTKIYSSRIRINNFAIDDTTVSASLSGGMVTVPLFTSDVYKGSVDSTIRVNIADRACPFSLAASANRININELVKDAKSKESNIYGYISSNLLLKGNLTDNSTFTGGGNIVITEGNLGPMPLLAPLVGHVYGFLRNAIPSMKNVEIQGGTCDFVIENRKVMTANLVLTGQTMNIYAKGFIDFDKNLSFDVENVFNDVQPGGDDFSNGILQFMAGFGKMIGKAHLGGTLDKPKWEFEYFANLDKVLGSQLGSALKNIFQ